MKYNSFKYCLKVWVTSALITPIILAPVMFASGRTIAHKASDILFGCLELSILLMLATLIPWLIVLSFMNRLFNSRLSLAAIRIIILLCVVLLPIILILVGAWANQDQNYWLAVWTCIGLIISNAICLWFHKLQPVSTETK